MSNCTPLLEASRGSPLKFLALARFFQGALQKKTELRNSTILPVSKVSTCRHNHTSYGFIQSWTALRTTANRNWKEGLT